jgi:hypothetical protein
MSLKLGGLHENKATLVSVFCADCAEVKSPRSLLLSTYRLFILFLGSLARVAVSSVLHRTGRAD